MTASKLRKLTINHALFSLAFDRDVPFHDLYPQSAFLDRKSGEIHWVYEEDKNAEMEAGIPAEENRAIRERIEATPDRYLEIRGLDHGDHHEILRAFLNSDWTDDEETWSRARNAYSGSIGRWKRSVADRTIIHAYYAFCDSRMKQMAEEFLRNHGIDPQWT
jgi:hypothetical protein